MTCNFVHCVKFTELNDRVFPVKVANKLKSELINNRLFYLNITPLGNCVVSLAQL